MRDIIEKEYHRYDIQVVPFGIKLEDFHPKKHENKNFVVGTIKSIESHNGISCLLDAANILKIERKNNINFLIVGDGTLRAEMEKKTEKLNLCDNVKFVGFVDHAKVEKYYDKLSVFIAVSERESFGVSVLEAAAKGIPSITSNIGGLTEVNLHNKTGIVIRPNKPYELADAIQKLYENKKMRHDLGLNAKKRVIEKFNWEDNVSDMINIYKNFI